MKKKTIQVLAVFLIALLTLSSGPVQLTKADYDNYDLLIAMDDNNIRNMHRILGGDPEGKIKKLMDYTSRGGDVADPWYSDRFDIAYRDIYEGCEGLLEDLLHHNR